MPSFVLVAFLLYTTFRLYLIKDGTVFFVVKVLMEQDLNMTRKLERLGGFKFFLTAFFLMGVNLATLYRGEVTKNMTA